MRGGIFGRVLFIGWSKQTAVFRQDNHLSLFCIFRSLEIFFNLGGAETLNCGELECEVAFLGGFFSSDGPLYQFLDKVGHLANAVLCFVCACHDTLKLNVSKSPSATSTRLRGIPRPRLFLKEVKNSLNAYPCPLRTDFIVA